MDLPKVVIDMENLDCPADSWNLLVRYAYTYAEQLQFCILFPVLHKIDPSLLPPPFHALRDDIEAGILFIKSNAPISIVTTRPGYFEAFRCNSNGRIRVRKASLDKACIDQAILDLYRPPAQELLQKAVLWAPVLEQEYDAEPAASPTEKKVDTIQTIFMTLLERHIKRGAEGKCDAFKTVDGLKSHLKNQIQLFSPSKVDEDFNTLKENQKVIDYFGDYIFQFLKNNNYISVSGKTVIHLTVEFQRRPNIEISPEELNELRQKLQSRGFGKVQQDSSQGAIAAQNPKLVITLANEALSLIQAMGTYAPKTIKELYDKITGIAFDHARREKNSIVGLSYLVKDVVKYLSHKEKVKTKGGNISEPSSSAPIWLTFEQLYYQ
eukprot:TRINITY_DN64721_c0_g1_i1.p1 TRINITY_DN64721_c0_g1~~TRINITY_DN64721_c0_g1_i1.p1  ORF type:complete len:380 (+),score=25.23 TRINITY_DN64721_c0_g1_i1:129-1268(+)